MTSDEDRELANQARRRAGRVRRSQREGEPTLLQQVAAVGVLGWIIVVPILLGVALGRLLDGRLGSGVIFTTALLMCGLIMGCFSAWRWMHKR